MCGGYFYFFVSCNICDAAQNRMHAFIANENVTAPVLIVVVIVFATPSEHVLKIRVRRIALTMAVGVDHFMKSANRILLHVHITVYLLQMMIFSNIAKREYAQTRKERYFVRFSEQCSSLLLPDDIKPVKCKKGNEQRTPFKSVHKFCVDECDRVFDNVHTSEDNKCIA